MDRQIVDRLRQDGHLVWYVAEMEPGIVLIRLAGLSPASKAEVVACAINEHASELSQAFAVITRGAIRIRRMRMTQQGWKDGEGNFLLVEDASEGGYVAQALGYSIFTEADTWEELKQAVQDAVQCHFKKVGDLCLRSGHMHSMSTGQVE